MQTFKQFIRESEAPIQFEDFILGNCREYMSELDADMDVIKSPRFSLYRGIAKTDDPLKMLLDGEIVNGHIKSVRSDRIPKDTPKFISEAVDDLLEKKFGWRPRTQAAFCYSYKNRGGVEMYGMKAKIYPMGEMQFIYSPKVRDLTYQLSTHLRDKNLWPGRERYKYDEEHNLMLKEIKAFIEENDFTNENLQKAMMAEGKPEIMVRCKKYLAIAASLHD